MAGLVKPTIAKKPVVSILGRPLSVDAGKQLEAIGGAAPTPAPAQVQKQYSGKSLDINAGLQKQAILGGSADSPESPRSKAAKLMKRQAGIGQLKTYHTPEDTL